MSETLLYLQVMEFEIRGLKLETETRADNVYTNKLRFSIFL